LGNRSANFVSIAHRSRAFPVGLNLAPWAAQFSPSADAARSRRTGASQRAIGPSGQRGPILFGGVAVSQSIMRLNLAALGRSKGPPGQGQPGWRPRLMRRQNFKYADGLGGLASTHGRRSQSRKHEKTRARKGPACSRFRPFVFSCFLARRRPCYFGVEATFTDGRPRGGGGWGQHHN
jgi:hypothetical protein